MPSVPPPESAPEHARREIGEHVRLTRLRQNLTQEAVAHAAGVDRRVLGRIEAGQTDAHVSTLARIGAVLGLRLIWTGPPPE